MQFVINNINGIIISGISAKAPEEEIRHELHLNNEVQSDNFYPLVFNYSVQALR